MSACDQVEEYFRWREAVCNTKSEGVKYGDIQHKLCAFEQRVFTHLKPDQDHRNIASWDAVVTVLRVSDNALLTFQISRAEETPSAYISGSAPYDNFTGPIDFPVNNYFIDSSDKKRYAEVIQTMFNTCFSPSQGVRKLPRLGDVDEFLGKFRKGTVGYSDFNSAFSHSEDLMIRDLIVRRRLFELTASVLRSAHIGDSAALVEAESRYSAGCALPP